MSDVKSKYVVAVGSYDDLDVMAFRFRSRGIEIRDCLSVQTTEDPRFILLGRREMDDSVVRSVVRDGTGALMLGACRIGVEQRTYDLKGAAENLNQLTREGNDQDDAKGLGAYGIEAKQVRIGEKTVRGRFPANLIFVHGEGCRKVGTKKVKNTSGSVSGNEPSAVTKNAYGDFQGRKSFNAYKNEDGKEEVPDWNCQPDCPVRLVDEQSGVLESGFMEAGVTFTCNSQSYGKFSGVTQRDTYGDEGGASRFFKQVQTEDGLDEYLNKLIRGDVDHD